MGLLEMFGGGGDPYDIYGDLFTERQKAAMRDQQQGQGLLRMAAALGQAAMPSRMPVPIGAVLGSAAGALGTGQDAAMEQMLKAAQTAEAVRQSQSTRALQQKFQPLLDQVFAREMAKLSPTTAAPVPGVAPAAAPAAPGPGAAPAAAAPFQLPQVPSYSGALGAPPPAAGMGVPPDTPTGGMPPGAMTGLLADPNAAALAQLAAGGPDQVIGQGQGKLQGLLSAAYGGPQTPPFGQDDSGTPGVRLASAALAPYATGNAVLGGPSSVEGVGDALSQKIIDMAAKMPPEIRDRFRIISGYRDAARQAQVNPSAPNSRHGAGTGPPGTGMAVDLASDPAVLDWITRNPQYGVGFPLAADPAERNHLEMLTAEGGRIGGSARRGGRFGGMGPDAGGGGGQESSLSTLSSLMSLLGLGGGASGLPDLSALLRLTGSSAGSGGGGDVLDSVIAPLESGNRNIMQQVVDPSTSSAGGYYQITNSTWREVAPKAGVDLAKYPTAISAPRELQKAVAQQLLDTRGVQPWADFNPAVAAATGYRRGGRFAGMGPDAGGGSASSLPDLSSLMMLTSGPGGLSLPPSRMSGGGGPAPDAAGAGGDQAAPAAPPINLQPGLSPEQFRQRFAPAAAVPAAPAIAPVAAPEPARPPVSAPNLPATSTLPATPPLPGAGVVPGLGVTPQALAALNAMAEMAKLGEPFKGLLETYYRSPAYLSEKTTAETKARTDIEDPLNQRMKVLEMALDMRKNGILYNPQTGEIKADPEWDKIHGRRAEDTKILELDYARRLKTFEEQQKIAEEVRKDQKEIAPQPIYRGGVIVEQPMTRETAVARLKEQSMRPGEYRDGDIVAKPIGNLSPDHQYKMSPTGGLTVEPIAGTPGAEKAAAAAKAKDISDRQLMVSRDIVVQDADRLENLIKTSPVPVTGMMGSLLSNMPGTPQSNAKALIDGLRARASIDAINRARAATGSTGMGQITMGEHALLANALANLEQSQGEAQLLFNLRRFKQEYIDAVHGPGAHSSLLPDTPVVKTPSSAPAGTAARAPADAAQLRSEAAGAIKAGKSRSAVIKRLQDMGVDAGGL